MHPRGHIGSEPRPIRVALYSHDSVGLGHTRRNLAIAHALAEELPRHTGRSATGLLLTSLPIPTHHLPAGFDLIGVPAIGKSEAGYRPRHLGVRMPEVLRLRSDILRAGVLGFRPDLLVIDRHVHGVGGELDATLATVRRQLPLTRVVLGLREVLDDPATVASEWAGLDLHAVRRHLDAIWVYGDPVVHDLRSTGEVPAELADLVTPTGYLAAGRHRHGSTEHERPYVLTMVGGGSDGTRLCLAAAAAPAPVGHTHVVVTGPQMSVDDHRAVVAAAGPDTLVLRSVPDGLESISGAAAIVTMAGYNSVTEALPFGGPMLLVPRETPRTEQLIRARSLERVGAVDVLRGEDLNASRLGTWLAGAVGRRVDRSHLDLGGLTTVSRLAAGLVTDLTLQEVSDVAV
ncbi:glycosyl transferase family 28 [Nostocoides sp. F2B08]|nr:glycosyl transferase family 28 [Tetrasphaera sp. F2B08]